MVAIYVRRFWSLVVTIDWPLQNDEAKTSILLGFVVSHQDLKPEYEFIRKNAAEKYHCAK